MVCEQLSESENVMIDLSICLPAIRPSYWERLYESFTQACSQYTFEVVFISPYDLPDSLKSKENVKHLKSYATSVRAAMEGSLLCEGRLIAVPADDGCAFPESLDKSIELLDSSGKKDAVILRYREGADMNGEPKPLEYWTIKDNLLLYEYMEVKLPLHFKFFMQPLMSSDYFREIGGWDCRFEHLAFAAHDLSYRIQRDGGVLHFSPLEVMNCDWTGWDNTSGTRDHAPVHESHSANDQPLFTKIYKPDGGINRTKIDFDNWKSCPDVWVRRWPNGVPK